MALALRAFANNGVTGGPVSVQVNKPAGVATGDIMIASLCVATTAGANLVVVQPTGWGLVQSVAGTNVTLFTYIKYATSTEPANYTFYFLPAVDACCSIDAYFSTAFGRLTLKATGTNPNGTNHIVPSLNNNNANIAGAVTHVALAGAGVFGWTAPGAPAYAKQTDIQSALAGFPVSLATGRLLTGGTGDLAGGVWTSAGAMTTAVSAITLFEKGAVQPTGYRGNVTVYDDLLSKDATGYGIDELSFAFPVDVELQALNPEDYTSFINIQLGDSSTGAATTTIKDKSVNLRFEPGKTFLWRATQVASWFFELGTKLPGLYPSGKEGCSIWLGAITTVRGNLKGYGSMIRSTSGNINLFSQAAGGLVSEVYNSIIEGTASISVGNAAQGRVEDVFNIDLQSTTTGVVLTNFFTGQARKVTVSCATPSSFITTGAQVKVKDIIFNGAPTGTSPFDISNTGAFTWDLIRPVWSQNAAPVGRADNPVREWWLANWSTRDGLTGAVLPGITLRLVDLYDNSTVCSGVTDSTGSFDFGTADIYQNAVIVAQYVAASVPAQTVRGPYVLYVNVDAPVNPAYASYELRFEWPYDGTFDISWLVGTYTFRLFRDVDDIIPMFAPVVVGPPVDTERIYYPGLSIQLPNMERIPLVVPRVA